MKASQRISQHFAGMALHPIELNLEMSNRCNLRCRMCPREVTEQELFPPIDAQHLTKLIRQLNVSKLRFSGLGEPMLAQNFWELVTIAREQSCRIAMVTNGTLLNERAAEKLCNGNAGMITVSLDAATTETYAQIRQAKCFEKVYGAIVNLYRTRENNKTAFPIIAINWVMMRSNYRQIPMLVDRLLSEGIKVDLIHCDPLVSYTLEMNNEVLAPDDPELYAFLDQARRRAAAAGIYLEFPYYELHYSVHSTHQARNCRPSCGVLWESVFVTGEGEYLPCCEYYKNPLGRINTDNPTEIWNGEKFRMARQRAMQGLPPFEYCVHCHKFSGYTDPRKKLRRAWEEYELGKEV